MAAGVRLIGTLYRWILPYCTEADFRKQNRLLDRFLKGHWLSRKTKAEPVEIQRPDGTVLRLLVCRSRKHPSPKHPVTGLLWIHGGGYAIGLPEQDFLFANLFCQDGGCVAVLPDYTRSLDAPYPAALEDCYLGLQWMWRNADQLGIRRDQIFVGGDSAGGGLTAALCLLARDRGEIPIAFQMPLYPMLDDREITDSSKDNDAPVWNTLSNRAAWAAYLCSVPNEDPVPAYAAPARADDLSGLPPALTYVGSVEPFLDETKAFCARLEANGVPVSFRVFEGCFHGFDIIAYPSRQAKAARKFLVDTFHEAQEKYYSVGDDGNGRNADES